MNLRRTVFGGGSGGSSDIIIDVTPIVGGTPQDILFVGDGSVLSEDDLFKWDYTNKTFIINSPVGRDQPYILLNNSDGDDVVRISKTGFFQMFFGVTTHITDELDIINIQGTFIVDTEVENLRIFYFSSSFLTTEDVSINSSIYMRPSFGNEPSSVVDLGFVYGTYIATIVNFNGDQDITMTGYVGTYNAPSFVRGATASAGSLMIPNLVGFQSQILEIGSGVTVNAILHNLVSGIGILGGTVAFQGAFVAIPLSGAIFNYGIFILGNNNSVLNGWISINANLSPGQMPSAPLDLGADSSFGALKITGVPGQSGNFIQVLDSSVNTMFNVSPSGLITAKAGLSTGLMAVGGTLDVNATTVGNIAPTESDLITYEIQASTLGVDGDQVEFECAGTIANNIDAKRIRAYLGTSLLFDTGAAGIPISVAINWVIKGTIIRTGSNAQKCAVSLVTDNTTLASYASYVATTEDLGTNLILKLTGEAASNDDILEEYQIVKWYPFN